MPLAAACAAALSAGGLGWRWGGKFAPPAFLASSQTFHVSTTVQDKPPFNNLVDISPDAKFLVYVAQPEIPPESVKPTGLLMVRRLDHDETAIIEGTEGAAEAALSPNGRWVAFSCAKDRASSKFSLKKVALENGRPSGKPETICELPRYGSSLCWASEREIVFSLPWEPMIYTVSAAGGEPRLVLREDLPKGIESWAEFRPLVMGKSILATRWSLVAQTIKVNTEVIDLGSGKRTLLLPNLGSAQYAADGEAGYLLAVRNPPTSLVAVRFDRQALHVIGEPVTVWSGNPINGVRFSASGTLAMSTQSPDLSDRRLAWFDEQGQPQPIPGATRNSGQIVISPDGGRVLARLEVPGSAELNSDLGVQDLTRRTFMRIPIQGAVFDVIWSNDGERIAYGVANDGAFTLWERRSDGSGEPVKLYSAPDSRTLVSPVGWSPDGKVLAFLQVELTANLLSGFLLEQEAASRQWKARPYVKSSVDECVLKFSPDGKWVQIQSSQSGRPELYVQRFSGQGEADTRAGRMQVSSGGLRGPSWWSADGKEIRYLDLDSQVKSVQVSTEPVLAVAEPKLLYSIKEQKTAAVAFAPDGRLMAVLQGESERTTKKVELVINFLEEIRTKMASTK